LLTRWWTGPDEEHSEQNILQAMENGTLSLANVPKDRRKDYMAKVLIEKVSV